MHQKKANAETLCKIWFVPFVPWLPSSMSNVWATMMENKCFMITIYIYIYIYIYILGANLKTKGLWWVPVWPGNLWKILKIKTEKNDNQVNFSQKSKNSLKRSILTFYSSWDPVLTGSNLGNLYTIPSMTGAYLEWGIKWFLGTYSIICGIYKQMR